MRPEGWEARLYACIKAASRRPFCWSQHDCALFAADCVAAVRNDGVDPAAAYRGRYTSEISAGRVLLEVCGGGVEAAATMALGEPMENPRLAQRGDVVLVNTALGLALGVIGGTMILAAAPAGLARLPVTAALKAWRV